MKINRYRINKAYICFTSGIKEHGVYWSVRLALHWFSSGFEFEGD